MSYSACDLQSDVDQLLDRLGLEITGDDCDGYTVRRGDVDLRTSRGVWFDTAAEASAAALEGLFDRVEDLMSAAKQVIDRWERGDLAEAVREMEVCVRCLDEGVPGFHPEDKAAERLRVRLNRLVNDGLRFGDCIDAFGVTADDDGAVAVAHRRFHEEGVLEIPGTTVVSRGEGPGTYVLAWACAPYEAGPGD